MNADVFEFNNTLYQYLSNPSELERTQSKIRKKVERKKKANDIRLIKCERDFFRMEAVRLNGICKSFKEKIDELISQRLRGVYCSIQNRVNIAQQIFSSIRGLGLLDTIMTDDTITEVMINGPDNIFVEKKQTVRRKYRDS